MTPVTIDGNNCRPPPRPPQHWDAANKCPPRPRRRIQTIPPTLDGGPRRRLRRAPRRVMKLAGGWAREGLRKLRVVERCWKVIQWERRRSVRVDFDAVAEAESKK